MRISSLALLSVIAFATPAAAQSPALVEVRLSNFKFTPQTIVLDHARPYVLRLVNDGGGGHDFTAPEFFAGAGVDPRDRALVSKGEVEVPGGEVREIHLNALRTGSYKLKCSHTLHRAFGMSGRIVVR